MIRTNTETKLTLASKTRKERICETGRRTSYLSGTEVYALKYDFRYRIWEYLGDWQWVYLGTR